MKNKMFGLLISSIVVAMTVFILATVFSEKQDVQAQSYYSPATIFVNASNTIPGATTNTAPTVIDVRGGKEVGFAFTSQFLSAGVSNVTVYIAKSFDRVKFDTDILALTLVGNGTNVITTATNITINAVPYLRVKVVNPSASGFDATNTLLQFNVK